MNSDTTPGRPLRVYDSEGNWKDFSTEEFEGHQLNQFQGWSCAGGTRSLAIRPDGTMHVGTCRVGGSIGNVFGEWNLPQQWIVCTMKTCSCGADLFIPKAKSPERISLLRKTHELPVDLEKKRNEINEICGLERVYESAQKQIFWEITSRCNFDCSYCSPDVHNKTESFQPFPKVLRATERLCEDFAKGEKTNFIISGGEPTLYPQFLDWVRLISVLGHHVSVHSNGSRHQDYYLELINHCDLNLSLHFDFVRIEKFFRVVEELTRVKIARNNKNIGHLEVKVMMLPGQYEMAQEASERLRKIEGFVEYCGWSIAPIRVKRIVRSDYDPREKSIFGTREWW